MDAIDRLGWAAGLAFNFHGLKVGIRVSRPEVLELLPKAFPPGVRPIAAGAVDFLYSVVVGGESPRPGVRLFHILYGGSARLSRTRDFEEILSILQEDMEFVVLGRAPRRLFLHAGAVGIGRSAVLIPGSSMSGKSTLTAALLSAGATCFSDEFAMIDARGRVHPYRRPISMRTQPEEEPALAGPEAFGSRWETEPLPVGLIALTRYEKGVRYQPRKLSRARGTVEVFAHTLTAVQQPRRALRWLVALLERVSVVKGPRGEAGEVARKLVAELGGPRVRAPLPTASRLDDGYLEERE